MSYLPYIKISTSRLSKDNLKSIAEAISQMCSIGLKEDDYRAWKMIHGTVDETEYDYLTKMTNPDTREDYVFPARLRWIPIQRKNVNALTGLKAKREFRYMLRASDKRSLKEKSENHMRKLINFYLATIDQKNKEIEYQFRQMGKQMGKLQQALQSTQQQYQQIQQQSQETNEEIDPKISQEIEGYIQQLEEQIEMFQDQMDLAQKSYENNKVIDDMEYEDIKQQMAKEDVDMYDRYINILVKVYRNKTDAIRKSESLFKYNTVTGKGYLYINLDDAEKLEYEPMDSTKIFYPYDENVYWVHRGKWVAIRERWSKSSFLNKYEKYLSEKEKEDYGRAYYDNTNFVPTPDNGAVPNPGAAIESDTVDILRIWYKHARKLNKKDDKYLITEIDNADKELYIQERYEVVLADNQFVYGGLDRIQPRLYDELQDVVLPVIGKTYSGISEVPYSPVKITRELAELYMILHFQKELLIVASGVKGDIVDKSQVPDSMSDEEHRYHKKMGTLYIKTMNADGRPVNAAFNQWKSYDDTLPQSVQIIENMCQQIDQQIGIMMGTPTAMVGQVQKQDQVGTFEMSNEQAMIVTETLFKECDEIETEAINIMANIISQYKNNEDEIAEIYQNEELIEFAKVPANILKGRRFATYTYQNSREEKSIKELKQLVLNQSQQGILPFDAVLRLYDSYSLKDLKTSIRYITKQAEMSREKQQNSQHEQQMQSQEAAIKAAQEYELMKINVNNQVKEMQIKLENAIKQSQLKLQEETLKLKAQEIGIKSEVDVAKIETEREVEMAYLNDQSQHQTMAHKLDALRLKMETMLNALDIKTYEKVETKKTQSKSYGKEKVKD